jgi:bifunctional enzyme CysN/CysC
MDRASQATTGGTAPGRGLLRFLTCGSVDDGKSTLIGRLLHDSRMIFDDQMAAVRRDSVRHGTTGDDADLALLVDGLEAEREQGITIDVAYRFFTTPARSFIVADTPGHEQYTRNMATGASNADAAVILVDARKGILSQTRRHSHVCALLGIRSVLLAVNKMDLVDHSEGVFERIVADFLGFAGQLGFASIMPVPISARFGDNVINRSDRMAWYSGPTVLDHLETVDVDRGRPDMPLRFPVQWINRPDAGFRGAAGTVASGVVSVGDAVVVAASGHQSEVSRIITFDGDRQAACAGDAVTLVLARDIDLSRGDVLSHPQARPEVADHVAAHLVWMGDEPMLPGRSYLARIGTTTVTVKVSTLKHKIDVNTLDQRPARTLHLNEIGVCNVLFGQAVPIDAYAANRRMGAFIMIDRATNRTVGAGMIDFVLRRATNIHRHSHLIDKQARTARNHHKPCIIWFTGLSGSGKSTIADLVERGLHAEGIHTMLLDGDNIRHGLNSDLGFTAADRVENIRRVGETAKLFVEAGIVVLCSFISPFAEERAMVRGLVAESEYVEVFIDVPIEECIRRDPKGLYAKARAGKIANFTGIDSPYEPPVAPDIRIDGLQDREDVAASRIIAYILEHCAP